MNAKSITGQLGLNITIPKAGKRTQFELEKASVMAWRAHLPMADTGATAKKVFLALTELNAGDIDPLLRYEILELIRPPLQLVCQGLKRHYTNQSTPLNKQKLTIANLAQTLQLEITNGYKMVLEGMHAQKTISSNKDIVGTIIYRTLHYNTLILLRKYQLYTQAPKNLWKENYTLYNIAKKFKLLDFELENSLAAANTKQDIQTAFLHIILLAATNPFQWRQNDQEALNNALDIWVKYVKLRKPSTGDKSKPGIFIFDLERDLAPEPLSLNRIDMTDSCMVIDLLEEVNHLQEVLAEVQADELKARIAHEGDPEFSIASQILQRLVQCWQNPIVQASTRFAINGNVKIAFGLSATHHFVSHCQAFDPRRQAKLPDSDENDKPPEAPNALPDFDVDNIDMEELDSNDGDNEEDISLAAFQKEEFVAHECSIVNISPTGTCLLWEESAFPPLQAGEIVGFHNVAEQADTWSIGVIRWLKHSDEQKLKIGIQLLAPNAKAVSAQIVSNNTALGYLLRCILLPEMENLDMKESIVTPSLPFKQGKDIVICTDDEKIIKAHLTRQVDATGNYRLFEYEADCQEPMVEKIETDLSNLPDDVATRGDEAEADALKSSKFKDIWKSI